MNPSLRLQHATPSAPDTASARAHYPACPSPPVVGWSPPRVAIRLCKSPNPRPRRALPPSSVHARTRAREPDGGVTGVVAGRGGVHAARASTLPLSPRPWPLPSPDQQLAHRSMPDDDLVGALACASYACLLRARCKKCLTNALPLYASIGVEGAGGEGVGAPGCGCLAGWGGWKMVCAGPAPASCFRPPHPPVRLSRAVARALCGRLALPLDRPHFPTANQHWSW